jgi:hypothetical protein
MPSDFMNNALRTQRSTATVSVDLDDAGAEVGAALRGQVPPDLTARRIADGRATLDPEPPPSANIREWQRWADGAAPLMDDQGRLPGEWGYTRPAQDSFDAKAARNGRWSRAHREARQAKGGAQ